MAGLKDISDVLLSCLFQIRLVGRLSRPARWRKDFMTLFPLIAHTQPANFTTSTVYILYPSTALLYVLATHLSYQYFKILTNEYRLQRMSIFN